MWRAIKKSNYFFPSSHASNRQGLTVVNQSYSGFYKNFLSLCAVQKLQMWRTWLLPWLRLRATLWELDHWLWCNDDSSCAPLQTVFTAYFLRSGQELKTATNKMKNVILFENSGHRGPRVWDPGVIRRFFSLYLLDLRKSNNCWNTGSWLIGYMVRWSWHSSVSRVLTPEKHSAPNTFSRISPIYLDCEPVFASLQYCPTHRLPCNVVWQPFCIVVFLCQPLWY